MTKTIPPIYFYIPKEFWPSSLPHSPEHYWQWQNSTNGVYRRGKYNWTLQTYLHLKALDFPCQLTDSLPDDGIVIIHRQFLTDSVKPGLKVMMVCIQADRPRHPYAQFHIVQNPLDVTQNAAKQATGLASTNIYYIPYWPQPELIPRDSGRGDRFENVGYFGIVENLAPELNEPSWREQLSELGLNWHVVSPERWNDYQEIDVVLAVRSFDYQGKYLWKPPSKLINAWHAGVPAILSPESAFSTLRKSELDYIEVTSPDQAISALKRLRDDPALRRAMAENSRIRAEEIQPTKIANHWRSFLVDTVTPAYENWCAESSLKKQTFLLGHYLAAKMKGRKVQTLKKLLTFQKLQDDEFKATYWN
jgi:hypothetical protein